MKLKDAIRYYELTGSDILTDLEIQSKYLTALEFDFVYDDFTEVMEKLYENILILWADSNEINEDTEMPSKEFLTSIYLAGIPKPKETVEKKELVFEKPSRFRKKQEVKENKTMNLVVSLVNSEMNISQFFDFEIELVVDILNDVSKKREEERKKNKSKKRRT